MTSLTSRQPNIRPREALRLARRQITEIAKDKRHHAFISFSGDIDQRLARRLSRALSHIGAWWLWPWQRRMDIFVDVDRLGAGKPLPESLRHSLDESDRLILLASKESRRSDWVGEEVTHWLKTHRAPVLLGHTGGQLTWGPNTGDFDWDATTALSGGLFRGQFSSPPTWARLSKARPYRFRKGHIVREGAAMLAAGILDVEPQALWRSELGRHRRRLFAVGILIVAAMLAISLAFIYAEKAATAIRLTVVQQLLANANEHAGRLDLSLLLTGQAYLADPNSVARHRLLELAVANPGLRAVLRTPPSGIGAVGSVGFSPDGQLLAAATNVPVGTTSAPAVLVWPGTAQGTPTQLILPEERGTEATSVTFDPSGRRLAVGFDRGGIAVFTFRAGGPVIDGDPVMFDPPPPANDAAGGSLDHGHAVKRISFSPDGHLLAASYDGDTTTVWNLAQRRPVSSFPGTATAFGPDGRTVASTVPATGELAVRDAATLALVDTINVNLVEPADLSYQPNGNKIAVSTGVARTDRGKPAIAVVDLAGRSARVLANTLGTSSVAYGPDDEVVSTSAVIEAASSPNPVVATRNPAMTARSVAIDPTGGTTVYAGTWRDGETGAIMLFDTRPTTTLAATSTRPSTWQTGALSPDGRTLAITDSDGVVTLLDSGTGTRNSVQPQRGVEAPTSLAFSPSGNLLAASNGRGVTIWTVADGVAHDADRPPGGTAATGLAFSPDGTTLAVATPAGNVELLSVTTPSSTGPALDTGPACDLAFSPDGHRLAVATADGAQLWELGADGNRRASLIPAASRVPPTGIGGCTGTVAVRFARNGTMLVTASGLTLSVTQLDTGRTDTLPPPELNPAGYRKQNPNWDRYAHLGVSPDGNLLAASGVGSGVFLWDLTTMRQVGPMLLSGDQVSTVEFSARGDRVVALGAYLTTWNIDPDYWLAWMCRTVQRDLTPDEWQRFGAGTQFKECA